VTREEQPNSAIVQWSAAEHLTFVATTCAPKARVEMHCEGENVWLSQKVMAMLYGVTVPAINQHPKRLFTDHELVEDAVIKQHLTSAADNETYEGETLWLTQAHMAPLCETTPRNITPHLRDLAATQEPRLATTCKSSVQVRIEGTRRVQHSTMHYSLSAKDDVLLRGKTP